MNQRSEIAVAHGSEHTTGRCPATYVVRECGPADGPISLDPGAYLESCDHDAGLAGVASWTRDPGRAMKFASAGEAFAFWRRRSRTRPTRPDGRPNRPLTAYHATIEEFTG